MYSKEELQARFDEIDRITDIEELDRMNTEIRDPTFTKAFWEQRLIVLNGATPEIRKKARLKCRTIVKMYNASIPPTKNIPRFSAPHGFAGIHISIYAKLGKNCTIFQHVTIGSNTLPDSKNGGFPTIGDNVFIGAGATIIGNVHIGNNVRIAANATVTQDVPDNCVVVPSGIRIIQKDQPLVNKFVSAEIFKKMQAEKQAAQKD